MIRNNDGKKERRNGKMFGRLGFNPRSSHSKTQKMVFDAALLKT